MLLNSDKTEVMNILINHRYEYDDEVFICEDFSIQPTNCVKFLGVFIDDHLSFCKHIDEMAFVNLIPVAEQCSSTAPIGPHHCGHRT